MTTHIVVKEVEGKPRLFVDHVAPGAGVTFKNGKGAKLTVSADDPKLWKSGKPRFDLEPGAHCTERVVDDSRVQPHAVALEVTDGTGSTERLLLVVEDGKAGALSFRFDEQHPVIELAAGSGAGQQVTFLRQGEATAPIEVYDGKAQVARLNVPAVRGVDLADPATGVLTLRIAEDPDDTQGFAPLQSGGTKQVDIFIEPGPPDG